MTTQSSTVAPVSVRLEPVSRFLFRRVAIVPALATLSLITVAPGFADSPITPLAKGDSGSLGPIVSFVKPEFSDVIKGNAPFSISIQPRRYPAQSLRIYVDNRPVTEESPIITAFRFNTELFSDGAHTISVRVTDTQGFIGQAEVSVFFNNKASQRPTNPATVLEWLGIRSGATLSGEEKLRLEAKSNFGIKGVLLRMNPITNPDGKPAAATWFTNQPPYEFSIDTSKYPDGEYVLDAAAWDSFENEENAPRLSVKLYNGNTAVNQNGTGNGGDFKVETPEAPVPTPTPKPKPTPTPKPEHDRTAATPHFAPPPVPPAVGMLSGSYNGAAHRQPTSASNSVDNMLKRDDSSRDSISFPPLNPQVLVLARRQDFTKEANANSASLPSPDLRPTSQPSVPAHTTASPVSRPTTGHQITPPVIAEGQPRHSSTVPALTQYSGQPSTDLGQTPALPEMQHKGAASVLPGLLATAPDAGKRASGTRHSVPALSVAGTSSSAGITSGTRIAASTEERETPPAQIRWTEPHKTAPTSSPRHNGTEGAQATTVHISPTTTVSEGTGASLLTSEPEDIGRTELRTTTPPTVFMTGDGLFQGGNAASGTNPLPTASKTAPRIAENLDAVISGTKPTAKAVTPVPVPSKNRGVLPTEPRVAFNPDLSRKNRTTPRSDALIVVSPAEEISTVSFTAKRDEPLSAIADRFKMPLSVVAAANGISANSRILKGQTVLVPQSLTITYKGQAVSSDVAPLLIGSTSVTPFRFLFEKEGGSLIWDEAKQQVTAKNAKYEVTITIGSDKAIVNSKEQAMDMAAFLLSGRTMVPTRFFEKALHSKVEWEPSTGRIYVASIPD